jgi:hypothetical protein
MTALWKGQLPLAQAFWEFAIVYMLLANLCATGAAFGAIASGLPAALAVVIFLLPIPYILVAVVGVWRSADAYDGPPHWAKLARYSSIVWGGMMAVI